MHVPRVALAGGVATGARRPRVARVNMAYPRRRGVSSVKGTGSAAQGGGRGGVETDKIRYCQAVDLQVSHPPCYLDIKGLEAVRMDWE